MHPNGVSLSQKNPLLQNEPNFKIKPIKPKLNRFFKMQPYATLDLGCLTSSSSSLRSAKVIQAYSSLFKVIQGYSSLKKDSYFSGRAEVPTKAGSPRRSPAPRRAEAVAKAAAGRRRVAALFFSPHLSVIVAKCRLLSPPSPPGYFSRPSKTTKNHEKPNNLPQILHNDPFASPCKIAYNIRLGAGFIRNPSPSEKKPEL